MLHQFEPAALDRVLAEGEADVHLGARPFHIRRSFIDDVAHHNIEESVASLRPLLVMHAPLDAVVGIDHASRLFQAAKHPKSFISLDRADHLLTRREDADYAAEMIATWASRYPASVQGRNQSTVVRNTARESSKRGQGHHEV